MTGQLVSIEGLDGSGKSTIARRLAVAVENAGWSVLLTREPGGTAVGEHVRELLLNETGGGLQSEAEALLFAAARAQLVGEVIRPALEQGALVIVDRFLDSSLAYQGGGRGLDLRALRQVQQFATGGLDADLKILLDVPTDVALRRRHRQAELRNRLDSEELEFYDRVRETYLALAREDPTRWRVFAADADAEAVWTQVWRTVEDSLAQSNRECDERRSATATRA